MKKILNPRSKTHWLGATTAIVGGLYQFAPQVVAYVPADWYGPIFVGLGVSITVLRNLTDTPIDQK